MPLTYLSNFWRGLEMPLINCEINLTLTWFIDCVISPATSKFEITDTKLYVLVVTLSIQDNPKLLEQLRFGFKRIIDWNIYQPKVSTERQNQYLDFLINCSFQGVNRLFALLFQNEIDRKVHTGYYLPQVETKYYNVMIDGKSFFNQPVESDMTTHDNIQKIATGQGDYYNWLFAGL